MACEITGTLDVNEVVKPPVLLLQVDNVAPGANATQNHSPGSAFAVRRVSCSAFGRAKIEIRVGPAGSEGSIAILHTSEESPNASLILDTPLPVSATENIQVIKTNLDSADIDIASTLQIEV